jgi:tyrosine-protein phosphatase YwqE
MSKKIIRLTENDLTHLIKRVIQEQSTRPFTISSVRNTNDDKSRTKTYTVRAVNGNVTVNGNKIGNKSIIKPSDKITMNEGDTIIFEDMPGYGQVTLSFKNNTPDLNLSWD